MKKFVSWRRVSTKRQGNSGLGLEAQRDIIDYFIKAENGELIADFEEVYTGTDLSGCSELKKAIAKTKQENAVLIIAKTDRLRNTLEALQILEEVGEPNIMFCDLPHTDRFTLTLFFAMAEREALLISLRTKSALQAKKERGELTGGACRKEFDGMNNARKASSVSRKEKAKNNPANKAFHEFIIDYQKINGKLTANSDFQPVSDELNRRGKTTSTGLPFNKLRARSMFYNTRELYN